MDMVIIIVDTSMHTSSMMCEVKLQLKSVLQPCKTEVHFCNLQNCTFAKRVFCNG
jgi:hypothetical protein